MNHTTVVGNVGRQPEGLKYSASGKAILKFSVADSRGKGDDRKTSWIDVVCFEELAEAVIEEVNKGDRVMVTGRLQIEDYLKKDGTNGKRVELIANEVAKSIRLKRDSLDQVKSALNATEVYEEELF